MERYQPFFMERFKHQKEVMSESGWMNGSYVALAVGAVMPKGKRYPDEPISFYRSLGADDEVVEYTDADRFWDFAQMYNASHPELASNDGEEEIIDVTPE